MSELNRDYANGLWLNCEPPAFRFISLPIGMGLTINKIRFDLVIS